MISWALGGGYTTNLDRAEVRTQASAVGQHKSRETDVPWPKSYIDARAHTGVDCQYVMPDDAAAATEGETRFYAAYHREWNDNDLVFMSREGGKTSNLLLAKTFSAGHVVGLAARSYQLLGVHNCQSPPSGSRRDGLEQGSPALHRHQTSESKETAQRSVQL
ncbi:hypothetical protein [Pseudomonas sp. NPDC096950]|uniref:hypothetical protein n=1 Tax=Pseudomonas sp. NPDC096950 TaxID=3364485 RepID=UPI00383B94EB